VIARILVALVILLLSALTYPGALVVGLATRFSPAQSAQPGPVGKLPWLHVAHPQGERPYIADDQGRMVLLHGAIPAGLLQYGPFTVLPFPNDPAAYDQDRCPAAAGWSPYPPLCRSDLQQMSALGFNSIRLPISWSLLEPERGRFDETYLDRISQVVQWARDLGMYVIIDMHQNAFSQFVANKDGDGVNRRYNSGAPRWATITDGLPSFAIQGQRELNPAVFQATTNFWYDRDGIQDEYIAAVAHVAHRFKNDSTVAGYGIYNEPWFGWNLPPGFDDLLLFPFYRRVIDAITGVHDGLPCWSGFFMPAVCGYRDLGVGDRRHLMFIDTGLLREVTDFPTHLGLPVSSYPNVVLALHPYTHIYTFDYFLRLPRSSYPWGGYDQGWDSAEREAKAMDAALFVEEFGDNPGDDASILQSQLLEEEKHRTGFAFWTWAETDGTWGMFQSSSGCMRRNREGMLARVYPRASADSHVTFHYESQTGAFTLAALGRTGDASTLVYIPPEVRGDISLSGGAGALTAANADGSRLVTVLPKGGPFTVSVAPHALALTGCA
jgi:endoglycosylceramidase